MSTDAQNSAMMAADFLRPVDLKLRRAEHHLRALSSSIVQWTSRNPLNTQCKLRRERLGYVLTIENFNNPAEADDWSLMIGDLVHNLRSALDNLVYALARLEQDPPHRPRDLAFPICSKHSEFNGRRKVIEQLPHKAAALIERIQPFHRSRIDEGTPESDPLVLLQALSNVDKHQIPIVALIAPKMMQHKGTIEFMSDEDAAANVPPDVTVWAGILRPGVTLLEHKTKHPVRSAQGAFNIEAQVGIEAPSGPVPAIPILEKLRWYVGLVVDQFRPFFSA